MRPSVVIVRVVSGFWCPRLASWADRDLPTVCRSLDGQLTDAYCEGVARTGSWMKIPWSPLRLFQRSQDHGACKKRGRGHELRLARRVRQAASGPATTTVARLRVPGPGARLESRVEKAGITR